MAPKPIRNSSYHAPQLQVAHVGQARLRRSEAERAAGLEQHNQGGEQGHRAGDRIDEILEGRLAGDAAGQGHEQEARPGCRFPADEQGQQIATAKQQQHRQHVAGKRAVQQAPAAGVSTQPFARSKPAGEQGGHQGDDRKHPGQRIEVPGQGEAEGGEAKAGAGVADRDSAHNCAAYMRVARTPAPRQRPASNIASRVSAAIRYKRVEGSETHGATPRISAR